MKRKYFKKAQNVLDFVEEFEYNQDIMDREFDKEIADKRIKQQNKKGNNDKNCKNERKSNIRKST